MLRNNPEWDPCSRLQLRSWPSVMRYTMVLRVSGVKLHVEYWTRNLWNRPKIAVLRSIAPCNLANLYHLFVESCCFHFQGIRKHRPLHPAHLKLLLPFEGYGYGLTRFFPALIKPDTFPYSTTLKVQVTGSVQTAVPNCQSTERHITEYSNIYEQRCGNVTLHVVEIIRELISMNCINLTRWG
jgi:hypothetical protein